MRALWLVIAIAGCWTGRTPDLARWHRAATADLLPDGEWGIAVLDVDLDSPAQRENEQRARRDPAAARKDATTCQIPSLHVAFAGYGHDGYAFALRGAFMRSAMIDCITAIATQGGLPVAHATFDGREVLVITGTDGARYFIAFGDEVIVAATTEPLMHRLLAGDVRGAMADPALEPLITGARRGGELWAAARVPADAADDVLAWLGARASGNVQTVVASIHVTQPYRIVVELGFAREADAKLVASALETKRGAVRAWLDPALAALIDAITVTANGSRVRITGTPPTVDWWKVIQAIMAMRQSWA